MQYDDDEVLMASGHSDQEGVYWIIRRQCFWSPRDLQSSCEVGKCQTAEKSRFSRGS